MNKANSLIRLCEGLEYPKPVLPSKYAKTKAGWLQYIKDECSRSAKSDEENITGDWNHHFFYSLTIDDDFNTKYKLFREAVTELLKGDYADLDKELPDGTMQYELYYLGGSALKKLQAAAEKDSKGFDSVGSRAYTAIMNAIDNAVESNIKNDTRYRNDMYYHPNFQSIALASIGNGFDGTDPKLEEWFRKQGYKW